MDTKIRQAFVILSFLIGFALLCFGSSKMLYSRMFFDVASLVYGLILSLSGFTIVIVALRFSKGKKTDSLSG